MDEGPNNSPVETVATSLRFLGGELFWRQVPFVLPNWIIYLLFILEQT